MSTAINQKALHSLQARMQRFVDGMNALPERLRRMPAADLDVLRGYSTARSQTEIAIKLANPESSYYKADERLTLLGLIGCGEITDEGLEILKLCEPV